MTKRRIYYRRVALVSLILHPRGRSSRRKRHLRVLARREFKIYGGKRVSSLWARLFGHGLLALT